MPYLVLPDQIPIYYVDEGPRSEQAVVLIHGEPFNVNAWQKNLPELARHFRVVAMDTRGRGNSGKTDEGHTVSQFGRDLNFVLESLGVQSAVTVGWSMGGSIVLELFKQFGKDRLAGFINIDQRPFRYTSEEHLQERLENIRTRRMQHHKERILLFLGAEANETQETIDAMVYECMKTPTRAHMSAVESSHRSDYRKLLNTFDVPTLIFCGKYGLIPPDTAEEMRRGMPDCKLVRFEHSGHFLPWTEAATCNQAIEEFARSLLR